MLYDYLKILQQYFVLRCWLKQCNIMMKTVDNLYNYVLQLDASKAFDRVSYSRLFNVLLDNNVCPYIVRLLYYMYLNQNCCVKWNSKNSTEFCVSNGVKQGAVISLILFSSYMGALFERLKRNTVGCHVGPVYDGAFVYADNVALVAPSLYSLRCMIATCEEFANEYQIDLNPTESKLICFNANIDHAPHIILNGQPVSVVFKDKHLGNYVSSSINDRHIIELWNLNEDINQFKVA